MADVLLNQCSPRIVNVSNSCDGSLTKADITGLTPAQIVSLGSTATDEAHLYRQMMLAKMSGVRENSLWDLMMSRIKNVKGQINKESIGNKSFFLPFIMKEQKDIVNANAFQIEAGSVHPDAGTTVAGVYYPKGSFIITVKSSSSPWTSTIENIERYFLVDNSVVVLNLSSTQAVQEPHFKIVEAINYDDGSGVEKAKVVIAPNLTDDGFDALSAAQKDVFRPTAGVVMLGTNSVSDYESWCQNQPVENNTRLLSFWLQTSRFTRCWDDEYKKYLEYIMAGNVNPYLQKFKELPMSEQNRQMYAAYQRQMMNTFWYGDIINENQTPETYRDLPKVNDPRGANSFLEYKADAIGVRAQLRGCNRLVDYTGAALNLNVLEEQLYALKRHREVDGGSVESIDVLTDRQTANRLKSLFADYYKARYGMAWERQFKPTEKIEFGQQTMWHYNSYEMDDAQVMLNVIVDPFFSDHKAHFAPNMKTRGNALIAVDWNDVAMGIGGTNKRESKTPDLETDPDFKCVISANITHTEMESTKWGVIIEDPKRHLIVENFSDECATYTYKDCNATAE